MEGGHEHVVGDHTGSQVRSLLCGEHAGGHAERILLGDGGGEDRHVGGVRDEEKVAGLVQVDLLAGPGGKVLESRQRAPAQFDVDRVGELRPHPAGAARRGSTRQITAFQQQHIAHPCLGEVKGNRGSHHAATDDHHLGPVGQDGWAHAKLTPCASGRSVE